VAAVEVQPDPITESPAADAAGTTELDPTKPKRRRGSGGGKGRKKTVTGGDA